MTSSTARTRLDAPAGSDAPGRTPPPGGGEDSGTGPAKGSIDGGRFTAGTLFDNRYRIVGLVGRGGMGEVYRADDLKLGQTVALKFLPAEVTHDPERLQRFLEEVRIARRITHPNVCRVHDIDESDGLHFLSMEYVDGGNLASLLRRIGRLPSEKALQMALEICAGLQAAHEQGILHRDLKPANIMLDEQGRVRLTDFGLAAIAEDVREGDLSGSPAYMAPEQLDGKGASIRSDIYSLGLVVYEMLTGKPRFQAKTMEELTQLHRFSAPERPSALVSDLHPAAESTVLSCLEEEPEKRPSTVADVSASLASALEASATGAPLGPSSEQQEGIDQKASRLDLSVTGIEDSTTSQVQARRQRITGAALIAVGVLLLALLLSNGGSLFDFWPLALIGVGAWLLPRRSSAPPSGLLGEQWLNVFAFLGGVDISSSSPDFRGGSLTAVVGGCEIDLSRASITGGEAVLHILAIMGGIEIRVPDDWTVSSEGVPLLGAFTIKTRGAPASGAKHLRLKGLALMSGVEVRD